MADQGLWAEAGQLQGQATQAAQKNAELEQHPNDVAAESGRAASQQIGEDRRQKQGAQNDQQYLQLQDKLQRAQNMMEITPQIALGLVKNTGDKEWMKAVGQKMRSDVVLGMYTHGIKAEQVKRAPRITELYNADGTIQHGVVYTDENGQQQTLPLDPGMSADKLYKAKNAGRSGGAGKADDLSFKKMKEFNRAYEKMRTDMSDPTKAAELKATNPDKFSENTQFLKDNEDQYDANLKALGKGGGAPVGGGSGDAGSDQDGGDNAPFDADAFIKDSLGKGQ